VQVGHANKSYSAKAVYGVMTILAVLDVMGDHPPSAWRAAVILFGTTFAVALIDVYAESVSLVLTQQGQRPDLKELWHEVSPVLIGAQAPTLVMIAAALGLWSVERGVAISQVLSFLILFGYGLRVGQTLHGTWLRQILSGLVLVVIGLLIVGIKVAVH
jgi:hemolysin III